MKKCFFTIMLAVFTLSTFAQSGVINKPVTTSDTTIGKVFFNITTYYDVKSQKVNATVSFYVSKKALISYNAIMGMNDIPEVPRQFVIDLKDVQTDNIGSMDNKVRQFFKNTCVAKNPGWVAADIKFF